ncbi:MAG: carboxypeptidase-like regulatory domain-containing protein [Bacteroidia bacterium]
MDDTIIKTITISGTLIDEKTKESMPFATIIVTDSLSNQLGTGATNLNGEYNFNIPKANICGKSINITASYLGYDTIIVSNIPIISLRNDIYIEKAIGNVSMMGGMIVTYMQDPEPFYLHEENPMSSNDLFTSEFDKVTQKRESIVKNNQR